MADAQKVEAQKPRLLMLHKKSKKGDSYYQFVLVDNKGKFHPVVGSKGNQVLAFPTKSGNGHLNVFEGRGQNEASEAMSFANVMSTL